MKTTFFAVASALALAGCTSMGADTAGASGGGSATAQLRAADGRVLANGTVSEQGGGLLVRVSAAGLQPGTYAVHVHTTGRCDAPDFTTAGGHWNPDQRQHGMENPQGAHRGDLPNLVVGQTGAGEFEYLVRGATLRGATPLLDTDGAAMIVHAQPDDMRSDPTGNAGGRLGCGVLS